MLVQRLMVTHVHARTHTHTHTHTHTRTHTRTPSRSQAVTCWPPGPHLPGADPSQPCAPHPACGPGMGTRGHQRALGDASVSPGGGAPPPPLPPHPPGPLEHVRAALWVAAAHAPPGLLLRCPRQLPAPPAQAGLPHPTQQPLGPLGLRDLGWELLQRGPAIQGDLPVTSGPRRVPQPLLLPSPPEYRPAGDGG